MEPLFAYEKGLFWSGDQGESWKHLGVQFLGTYYTGGLISSNFEKGVGVK